MKEFDQLTRVKSLREQSALRKMMAQRRKLEEAVAEREQAQHRLDDFRRVALEEETRLYEDLCSRVVRVRDIRFVDGAMLTLKSQDKQHLQEVTTARTQCEAEQRQLDTDRGVHAHAQRIHEKFFEVADFLKREDLAAKAAREELEVEDTATRGARHSVQEPSS